MTSTFSAVRTTGIYCHPECSASPRPEHVTEYRSAAAAEADGFRACLRCRPYRRSDRSAWTDGPELVCRAVQLVLDGTLDGATEDVLAARVGASARHLRRLFVDHLGATPDQLARSRRTHFARRLLDDTDLSITDIAFASGFGSVRQLSRSLHSVFRAGPTELRGRRRRTDRLVADGGLECRIPYAPPLDWTALLEFLGARAVAGVEAVDGDTYRRTITTSGGTGMVEVRPGGADHLVARFHLPGWRELIHHVARVRHLFGLDVDPAEPAEVLARDHLLAPWPEGLRVPGTWDPFEAGVRAILGQQVSVSSATATAARIASAFGAEVGGLGPVGLDRAFPDPATLADADLPVPRRRAEAVRAFAAAHAAGALPLDNSAPLDELVAALTGLPGIGPWTAHYLALRLGERDAFPADDLHVRRILAPEGGAARAERWRPWRAHATVRLWAD